MKLLPTGRKSSLAIFTYSTVVGMTTYFLHYLSGLLRSVLVEIGITEDMHNPVCKFVIWVTIKGPFGFYCFHLHLHMYKGMRITYILTVVQTLELLYE